MVFRSLGIVLPAYNEEARLGPALDELVGYLRAAPDGQLPACINVLVVDDGSTDGTADLVRARPEFAAAADVTDGTADPDGPVIETVAAGSIASDRRDFPSLRLMSISHGGKGSAVRAGMLAAEGELLVFADADMATPPDQLPRLVEALATADVALGSRIQPDGSDMRASQPRFRRLVGRLFRFAAQLLLRITSIVFDADLIYLARRRGYRMAVVPVVWADRRGSRLNARPRLALRVAWDLIRIRFVHGRIQRLRTEDALEPTREP